MVVLSDDGGSEGGEDEATLVPGVVQHVRQTGYPSNRGVKESLNTNQGAYPPLPSRRVNPKGACPIHNHPVQTALATAAAATTAGR